MAQEARGTSLRPKLDSIPASERAIIPAGRSNAESFVRCVFWLHEAEHKQHEEQHEDPRWACWQGFELAIGSPVFRRCGRVTSGLIKPALERIHDLARDYVNFLHPATGRVGLLPRAPSIYAAARMRSPGFSVFSSVLTPMMSRYKRIEISAMAGTNMPTKGWIIAARSGIKNAASRSTT